MLAKEDFIKTSHAIGSLRPHLNSTPCSLTAMSCASSSTSLAALAPLALFSANWSCLFASPTDMPRTREATSRIFLGEYLMCARMWQTYAGLDRENEITVIKITSWVTLGCKLCVKKAVGI